MNDDLIADIWTVLLEHLPEKNRADAAAEYVNVLLDHGVKETLLVELMGVDTYLDKAIHYAIDDNNDEEDYYEDEE
jgi:hypothetical protein